MIVFVYGTLMKGEGNHKRFLETADFIGRGEAEGFALYDVSFFPGIIEAEGELAKGELYQIDQETLERLDRLEGEGSLYIRKIIKVKNAEGIVDVFGYIWNDKVNAATKVEYVNQPWKGEK